MKVKIMKLIISLMFTGIIIGVKPVQAEEVKGKFEIDEYGALYRYNGNDKEVVIPNGVRRIMPSVFEGNTTITSVVIPEDFSDIGEKAFYKCTNLEKVALPADLFYSDSLAFEETPWLDNLRKSNSLVVVNGILFDGKGCVGAVKVPDDVRTIGGSAFAGNKSITSVELSDSIEYIGTKAFYKCTKLEEIDIPENYLSIRAFAFEDTLWIDNQRKLNPMVIINGGLIDGNACVGAVTIPSEVDFINEYAFSENDSITSINFTDNTYYIQQYAFASCSRLQSVTIPENVSPLFGYNAFFSCKSLKSVTILGGGLMGHAFGDCDPGLIIYGSNDDTSTYIKNSAKEYGYTYKEIALNKTKSNLAIGSSLSLKMNNGGKMSSWKTSNSKVATVKNGKVTAISAGTATITGKYEGKSYKCIITVKEPAFNKTKATLDVGKTLILKMTNDGKITEWKSSNTKVATVKDGKVTAKAVGTATISGKYNGKNYKCTVTVVKKK